MLCKILKGNSYDNKLWTFISILKYVLSEQKELVHKKLFKVDLNCLVLRDKFFIWEGRLFTLIPK